MTRKPKPKKRKSRKLTPQEKEQRSQIREITTILKNIGFSKIPHIDGKEIVYDGRTTEMDDIFINENVILVTEYTIGSPGKHLLAKDVFYKKVLSNPRAFISFMLHDEKLKHFKKFYDEKINKVSQSLDFEIKKDTTQLFDSKEKKINEK